MPLFTVTSAAKKKDLPDKGYGPRQVISLNLQDEQGQQVMAEWSTKATTVLPVAGAKLDGTVEPGQYGNQFKKQQPVGGFGGGGGRPKDPAERAAIAASVALREGREAVEQAVTMGLVKPADLDAHAELWKRYANFAFNFIDRKSKAA
jgi:hypothetical protein